MNIIRTELLVCGCLPGPVGLGVRLRRLLPEHHLTADSRDAVKPAMGLVATMTALFKDAVTQTVRRMWPDVASLEAFADHTNMLVDGYFSRLLIALALQHNGCPRADCFDLFRGLRGFFDMGVGPTHARFHPDFQRTDDERGEPVCKLNIYAT